MRTRHKRNQFGKSGNNSRETFLRGGNETAAPPEKEGAGPVLIYGVNSVTSALKQGSRQFEEILVAEGEARDRRLAQLIEMARERGIRVRRPPVAELTRLAGDAVHQGVVGRVSPITYHDADDVLPALSNKIRGGDKPIVLILDGVEDPGNLGAVIRTAECSGVSVVFVPQRRSAGVTDVAVKASAGAVESIPICRVGNLSRLIEELKEAGFWIVGAAGEASTDYTAWDWCRPSALVLGGEASGIHRLVREECDQLIRISMKGRIESLNVSVAAGVILFEALRRRSVDESCATPTGGSLGGA